MKTTCLFLLGLFLTACAPAAAPPQPQDFKMILANPERPQNERALDASRKPEEVLSFYGVKPGMKVADLLAARGYYTAVLSQAVGEKGLVYSVNNRHRPELEERLKHPAYANVRRLDSLALPANADLDFALIHLNYHDLPAATRASLNKMVFAALKPGGVYGIVDHSAKDGSGEEAVKSLHRIDKALVVKEVTAAGFSPAGEADIFKNPKDDRTMSVLKDRGTSDRFVLRFQKPK
jgi:predicted methyltransferase